MSNSIIKPSDSFTVIDLDAVDFDSTNISIEVEAPAAADPYQYMPTNRELTTEEFVEMCEKASWKAFELVMPNDDVLSIIPCGYGAITATTVEYFLVGGPLPWMGNDTAEKLVKSLNSYQQQLDDNAAEKVELHEFYDKHIANGIPGTEEYQDACSWYSDWHKDVYGFRPR